MLVDAGKIGYVHLPAAGVDVPLFHSLVRACISKQVLLSHCPGVYAKPMAQYCLAYILQILRRVPEHAHNQSTKIYKSLEARDARGVTIGVLGAGGIGTEVGKLGKAFGSRTIGWRRQIAHDPAAFDEQRTGVDGLHSILREADFVIVAVPHTPATRRLLSAAELAMMKPTAWLINVSRGRVDEAALAAALAAPAPTTPAGAVLDVYEVEPLPAASPLWQLPAERCILTSHDSWRTSSVCRQSPVLCRQPAAEAGRGGARAARGRSSSCGRRSRRRRLVNFLVCTRFAPHKTTHTHHDVAALPNGHHRTASARCR